MSNFYIGSDVVNTVKSFSSDVNHSVINITPSFFTSYATSSSYVTSSSYATFSGYTDSVPIATNGSPILIISLATAMPVLITILIIIVVLLMGLCLTIKRKKGMVQYWNTKYTSYFALYQQVQVYQKMQ